MLQLNTSSALDGHLTLVHSNYAPDSQMMQVRIAKLLAHFYFDFCEFCAKFFMHFDLQGVELRRWQSCYQKYCPFLL